MTTPQLNNSLTPELRLTDYATCAITGTHLQVKWCDHENFVFNIDDILTQKERNLNEQELISIFTKYVDLNVPVTLKEAELKGRKVYTHEGWHVAVKRVTTTRTFVHPFVTPLTNTTTPDPTDFLVRPHDGLLLISSGKSIAHESISHGKEFLAEIIKDYYDIEEYKNTTLLVTRSLPQQSVIIGHKRPVMRFSEELRDSHSLLSYGHLDNI